MGTPGTRGDLSQLLSLLPRIAVDAKGRPDLPACSPQLLLEIATRMQRLQRVVLCGVGGAGRCILQSSEQPTHSDIQAVAALVAELSDVVLMATHWADECFRLTMDFTGGPHD